MTTEQINMMIDSYFDGELEKGREPILFTHLSLNEESRDYFKALNKIRNEISESVEDFPLELEERILYSAASTEKRWFKIAIPQNLPVFFSYAAAIVLLAISIFLYSQSMNYKETIESKIQQVNKQNQLIELLYNSLPPATVTAEYQNKVYIEDNS